MSEDNRKIPDLFTERPKSFKGASISILDAFIKLHNKSESLLVLTDADGNPLEFGKVRALFLTSAGVIAGDLPGIKEDTDSPKERLTITDTFFKALDMEAERLRNENPNISLTSGGVIPLSNAEIRTNTGATFNLNEFMLFTEDVVGFYVIPSDYKFT